MAREKGREADFLALVAAGVYEVRPDGSIWKRTNHPGRRDHVLGGRYAVVAHYDHGFRFSVLAHRIVYSHFYGPIQPGCVINHKNGNKADNRPENLEAVTQAENNRHAVRTRLNVSPRGDRRWNTKLADAVVVKIREDYASGNHTQAELAQRYGVDFRTFSDVVRGRRRTHLPGPIVTGPILRRQQSVRDPVTGRYLADPIAPGSRLRNPASPNRAAKALRQAKEVDVEVLDRSKSLYRVTRVSEDAR